MHLTCFVVYLPIWTKCTLYLSELSVLISNQELLQAILTSSRRHEKLNRLIQF